MTDKATNLFDKLAKPAQRALANAGIKTLEQLSQLTEAEFMQLHGIGKIRCKLLKPIWLNIKFIFKIKVN
jgi:hypothetical protein